VLTAQNAFLAFTEEASVGVEPFYAMLRASSQKKKKNSGYHAQEEEVLHGAHAATLQTNRWNERRQQERQGAVNKPHFKRLETHAQRALRGSNRGSDGRKLRGALGGEGRLNER
jgi:hypothetical protein